MFLAEKTLINGMMFLCKIDCPHKKLNLREETINEETNEKGVFLICENTDICKNAVESQWDYKNSCV